MLLLAVLGISVALVPVAGGRVLALTEIELRRTWFIAAALALQLVIGSVSLGSASDLHAPAHIVSYLLAGAFILSNSHVPGVWLIGVGGALNLAAILLNGGIMPASAGAIETAGLIETEESLANSAILPNAKLAFLGDLFAVPEAVPFSNVFSIGDVFIAAGAALAVFGVCCRRSRPDATMSVEDASGHAAERTSS